MILTKLLVATLVFFKFNPVNAGNDCTTKDFFHNFVQKDKDVQKGSANTFSKGNKAGMWFWHEKRMLINPGDSFTTDSCKAPILMINRHLSLKDGILSPGEEVNGSTYLVTHDWARDLIYDAVMHGETIRVLKR